MKTERLSESDVGRRDLSKSDHVTYTLFGCVYATRALVTGGLLVLVQLVAIAVAHRAYICEILPGFHRIRCV